MDDKIYVEADNSIWKLIDGQDDPILLTAAHDPNNIVNEEIEEED
jgi:hypothetical protein|tara:strand:- start:3534 stop:3668 length:135 start_codon:yes stop_codon:yes gene_type:complete